jgi:D-alanyl-D-alanine carboxypeptidase
MGGHAELEQALQALVDAPVEAGFPSFPSAVLVVDAPDIDFYWKGAAGMANVEAEIPMAPDTPFRISGISRTMLAALVLELAEDDLISLDDSISQYLNAEIIAQLNGPNGEPYGETITVRQLLNGTSGVAGYFFAIEEDMDDSYSPDFVDIIIEDQDKIWRPEEVIAYTNNHLNSNLAPGETFAANDMEFLLLDLIVEAAAGMTLNEAYQAWLFEPLGMTHSFVVQAGDPDMEAVAHVHYMRSIDISDYASLSWFSGDIVSTADDLIRFMRAWVDDDIFSDPASKEAMTQWTSMASGGYEGYYYGLGLVYFDYRQTEFPELGEFIFHSGLWNGFLYYWPQYNIVFAGTLNQVMPLGSRTLLVFPTMDILLPYVAEE